MRATPFSLIIITGLVLLLSSTAATAPLLLAPIAQGNSATYAFSITATSAHTCYSSQTTGAIIACPLDPLYPDWVLNANGTIAWRAITVNQTVAVLNDTVTLNLGTGSTSLSLGPFSFEESVDLSSRQATLVPSQVEAQTFESIVSQYGSMLPMGGLNASLLQQIHSPPVYTMWWVNTPLALGDNVTILAFPVRVNGTRTIDLGSLGSRSAWTLSASISRSAFLEMPCAVNYCPYNASSVNLMFAYDQSNGMLLTSDLDLQTYTNTLPIYSAGVQSSIASIVSTSTIHASLKLVSQDANPAAGVTYNPNPSLSSPTSSSINNNQAPSSSSNSNQASPAPTLLAAIGEGRNVASVAIAIAIVGLLGLLVFRRARKHTERSGSPA